LLHTITDSSDAPTLLVDGGGLVRFSNRAAVALAAGGNPDGSSLAAVFDGAPVARLAALAASARATGETHRELIDFVGGAAARRFQASAVPVAAIGPERDLVLFVLQDVTELEQAHRRHDALLQELVTALVRAVNRHDPYAREHGTRVAEVADALAAELGLPVVERENLRLAATLANVGKAGVPDRLLTKTEPLTEAERGLLRTHVQQSLGLLEGLPLAGPVLEVIAQKQEHLDGSGYPRGLVGEALSLPGRILAVANAFVALVSARAYRDALPLRGAAAALLADADTKYDRRVVAALLHVIESRRDWSSWESPPAR
jgi:HD-GYP domain-containing protein (c-di-GMP phosphodiesterase class II)